MFGSFFYLFDVAFALFPLFPAILGIIRWRKKRGINNLLLRIAPWALISAVWIPILGIQLYHKTANYLFLTTLQANNVTTITVGESVWSEQADIQTIVTVLNHPIWHVVNHDVGGPYETMTINLHSGQAKVFRVGRHNYKDGALIQFFRPYTNSDGFWADGDTFIPQLPTILENLGHPLPIRSQ